MIRRPHGGRLEGEQSGEESEDGETPNGGSMHRPALLK
jgi:hypothetical protein